MRQFSRAALVTVAMMASGCTTMSLEELRQVTPQGSEFQNALAQYYLDFAEEEAKDYDWADSMLFADKGLMAAYGKDTPPEDVSRWSVPSSMRASLEQSREALMAALENGAAEKHPDVASRAQFNFDCWLEQQEENWEDDEIAYCRDGFAEAMQQLSGKVEPREKEQRPLAVDRESTSNIAPETVTYVVFFEANQSVITVSGKKVIDEVIAEYASQNDYEVILNGHSDSKGDATANLKLSQRRAEAVKQRLLTGGIKEEAIKLFAFGETDGYIKTKDNVSEPANRRVEIFLND